jgi:hypothetical protein
MSPNVSFSCVHFPVLFVRKGLNPLPFDLKNHLVNVIIIFVAYIFSFSISHSSFPSTVPVQLFLQKKITHSQANGLTTKSYIMSDCWFAGIITMRPALPYMRG